MVNLSTSLSLNCPLSVSADFKRPSPVSRRNLEACDGSKVHSHGGGANAECGERLTSNRVAFDLFIRRDLAGEVPVRSRPRYRKAICRAQWGDGLGCRSLAEGQRRLRS